MYYEIVIDTNILEHASNPSPSNNYYLHAKRLLDWILDLNDDTEINHQISICVDGKWDFREPFNSQKNTSEIVKEYRTRFNNRYGAYGWIFLEKMYKDQLVKSKHKRPLTMNNKIDPVKMKEIKRLIKRKSSTDRIFIGVTCNTDSESIVSNDAEDFPTTKRPEFFEKLNVCIYYPCQKQRIESRFFSPTIIDSC